MILISQDKRTTIFLEEIEMFKICPENTIYDSNDIKCVYVIKLYPKLKDYFNSKISKTNYCIEMARYNTEERAISALENVTNYRYTHSIYTFPPDVDKSFIKTKIAAEKYSNTSYL